MNKKIILYFALMAFGLYVMPNTVSLFAGQHTFYSNAGISCEKCHSDVLSQVEHSGYVYEKHKLAAGNFNYTTYLSLGGIAYNGSITAYDGSLWTWDGTVWQNSSNPSETANVSLDVNRNGQIEGGEICMLCHNATLFGEAGSTHTGATVRACDDDRCHGNRIYSDNNPLIIGSSPNITAAGYNLSLSNAHQPFYLQASNMSSNYGINETFGRTPGNANGSSGFISRGFWACEGCHTDITVNITILPASPYNHSVSNPEKKRYLP